jgi:hypothetical protein
MLEIEGNSKTLQMCEQHMSYHCEYPGWVERVVGELGAHLHAKEMMIHEREPDGEIEEGERLLLHYLAVWPKEQQTQEGKVEGVSEFSKDKPCGKFVPGTRWLAQWRQCGKNRLYSKNNLHEKLFHCASLAHWHSTTCHTQCREERPQILRPEPQLQVASGAFETHLSSLK